MTTETSSEVSVNVETAKLANIKKWLDRSRQWIEETRGQTGQTESAASPHAEPSAEQPRSDSSEAMIEEWKNELRREKEEELEEIFAVIDKLAAKNANQRSVVQETVDSFMDDEDCGEDDGGEEVDEKKDRDYENVEIPDQALSEYIDHADLTDEESNILNDNTTKMYSWIIYQLCQEIMLGE